MVQPECLISVALAAAVRQMFVSVRQVGLAEALSRS